MAVVDMLSYSDKSSSRKINSPDMFVLEQAFYKASTFVKCCWAAVEESERIVLDSGGTEAGAAGHAAFK